jgi:hypothetical protein
MGIQNFIITPQLSLALIQEKAIRPYEAVKEEITTVAKEIDSMLLMMMI